MNPAIISLNIKRTLDESEQDAILKRLHSDCLNDLLSEVDMVEEMFKTHITQLSEIPSDARNKIFNTVAHRPKIFTANTPVRILLDDTISTNFNYVAKEVRVDVVDWHRDENNIDYLTLHLTYLTHDLTLLDSLSDSLIFVEGDQTGSVLTHRVIKDVKTIKLSENVWINTYQTLNPKV
ncbi:MAG: hypothetical protein K1X91_10115 [Bacteriodetes bacterium]|nr:hypothetical protein [Bacteroidota bacterium]